MKSIFIGLAVAAVLATATIAQQPSVSSRPDIAEILANRIDRDQANIGISVAVVEDGKTSFVSHGSLSAKGTTPVDEHTLFEAGSITKVMTNLLLAQLVLDGRIDLDAPLSNYLPAGTKLPERDGKALTGFDLATHSAGFSGLPEAIASKGAANPYSGFSAEELLAWVADYELPRAIGTQFEYSNVGTALLAQAVTYVSGTSYATLLQEQILDPLGMTETHLATNSATFANMATGHDASGQAVSSWDMDAFVPVGGLVSNAVDLAKFISAASGQVDSPLAPAFAIMLDRTRPTASNGETIGLGWFNLTEGDRNIVWHNGITGGFRSFTGYDADNSKGVVVLSNMVTGAGIEDIGLHVLDDTIPLRSQPSPRDAVAIDPAILPTYVGEYALAPGVIVAVTTEDDRLFAQLSGQERFEIFPESDTRFFYRVVEAQITFSTREDGVAMLTLHQNGQDLVGVRQ